MKTEHIEDGSKSRRNVSKGGGGVRKVKQRGGLFIANEEEIKNLSVSGQALGFSLITLFCSLRWRGVHTCVSAYGQGCPLHLSTCST